MALRVAFLFFFWAGWATAGLAQTAQGGIRGDVVDESGGVLPGVTVVASLPGGQVLAKTVTNADGAYRIDSVPAGPVRIAYQLEGFDTALADATVPAGADAVISVRLRVASVRETVHVVGQAGDAGPPLPPPPEIVSPPAHDRDSVCGPAKPDTPSTSFGIIRARRHEAERALSAQGDELIIGGGALTDLDVGRNFAVRRHFRVESSSGGAITAEHTAGVVQIVAAEERTFRAVVVYACDELVVGDFLASFNPEPLRPPEPAGTPAYEDSARILFADAGQMLGSPRRMMVIDRGAKHDIRVGQRLTLFRRARHTAPAPLIVGDAVVVAVRADSATIRVERATDAIAAGDGAAPQRPPVVRSSDGRPDRR